MKYQEKLNELNQELKTSGAPDDMLKDLLSMQLQHRKLGILETRLQSVKDDAQDLRDLHEEAYWRKEMISLGVSDPDAAIEIEAKLKTFKLIRDISQEQIDLMEEILSAKLTALDEVEFLEAFRASGEETLDETFKKWAAVTQTPAGKKLKELLDKE